MAKYRCKNCGYAGNRLTFQFDDFGYCVATNEEEPKYKSDVPKWVEDKIFGESKIGEPVGCPKCHAWGSDKFEII